MATIRPFHAIVAFHGSLMQRSTICVINYGREQPARLTKSVQKLSGDTTQTPWTTEPKPPDPSSRPSRRLAEAVGLYRLDPVGWPERGNGTRNGQKSDVDLQL
jgi:hypothetical protein